MSRYNLIDEKWIPVRYLSGEYDELGILATLTNVENIAVIEAPSPLVTVALHRFLLAVLYRALEGPCDIDEAKKYFKEGLPEDKIQKYLEKWKDRFCLFDDKYPFMQIPEFTPKNWRSWTVLAAEHNADNAKVLFDHITLSMSGSISFAAAVRWLLAAQTFAVSTGKSEIAHTGTSPSASALMVIPIGKTLLDTLCFCLVPQNKDVLKNDLPIWERPPETVGNLKPGIKRKIFGIADMYSWRGRSVRFNDNNTNEISEVAFASGVNDDESDIIDPMLAYAIVDVKNNETKATEKRKVIVHLHEKGVWRDFDSLLPDNTQLAPKVIDNMVALTRYIMERIADSIMVLGQKYNPPRPNIVFWRKESFILPKVAIGDRYIRGDIHSYLAKAENTNKSLYSACETYAQSLLSRGERKPEKKDITNFIDQMNVLPCYWSMLERKFHEILRDYALDIDPDDIHRDWFVAVRNALSDSWQLHQDSIAGSDAWAIRAMVKADDIIAKEIAKLNKEIKLLKEEVTV